MHFDIGDLFTLIMSENVIVRKTTLTFWGFFSRNVHIPNQFVLIIRWGVVVFCMPHVNNFSICQLFIYIFRMFRYLCDQVSLCVKCAILI